MAYVVERDDDGVVIGVRDGNTFHPKNPTNPGWKKFLAWNARQNPPLDVSNIFNLSGYKQKRIEAIRARSNALMADGFTHNSKLFNLDTDALLMLLLIFAKRARAGTFPIRIPTKFGRTLSIADATAFDAFCDSAIARYRAITERAGELIEAVTTAADKAAVDAVIDDRA